MSARQSIADLAAAKLDEKIAKKDRRPHAQATPVADAVVELIPASSVELEPMRWLWHEYIPLSMLTLLAGAPGCGKTTIAMAIAATLTNPDGRWPNGARCGNPGRVVIWSGEDTRSVLTARLKASGADLTRVVFVGPVGTGDDAREFDPAKDWAALEAAVADMADLRLVVVDPIVSVVAGDGHKANEVRRALQAIVSFAQRKGCAVLGITHLSKGSAGGDPVERVIGSIAYGAVARMVMIAAKQAPREDEEQPRVLLRAKCNCGPDTGGFEYVLHRAQLAPDIEGQFVAWGNSIDGSARDILAEAETQAEPDDAEPEHVASALDDAMLNLYQLLCAGPLPAKTVYAEARAAGQSRRTIERAKNEMAIRSFKEGGEWRWRMPPESKNAKVAKAAKAAKAAGLVSVGDLDDGPPLDDTAIQHRHPFHPGDVGDLGDVGDVGDLESVALGDDIEEV